jgi:hypothetical protein
MPNYTKGNIYKLCCNDTSIKDEYIGSTCNFIKRKNAHKTSCNNEKGKKYNMNVYSFIRENGGWNNWSMILVEEVCCENKKQLNQKERECVEKLKPTLNKIIPNRGWKERSKEYQKTEKYKEFRKSKKYKEWKKNYDKEYDKIKIVCECGREVMKRCLNAHKKRDIHKRLMNQL